MSASRLGNRAAAVAVLAALLTGLLLSLALRPPGAKRADAAPRTAASAEADIRVDWRVALSFQTTLPVTGDNPLYLQEIAQAASGGALRLQLFEPGELVPALGVTEAVRTGKIEAGYTWLGYDQGRVPAAPLLGAVPFGMEPWEYAAWWFEAGGRELGEALYAKRNLHVLFCGMTGPETAGWFREPVASLADVEGLKIRFAGIGGKVMERIGASVTMLPGGELFQALEKGAIDATEYALPVVDQSLGFNRVAPYNYYPGWHQPSTAMHLVVNQQGWESLTEADRKLLELVCTAGAQRNLARAEALQGEVIAGFPEIGVSARRLPEPILRELARVNAEVLAEEAARDEDFARILASQKAFRADYAHWKALAYLRRDF